MMKTNIFRSTIFVFLSIFVLISCDEINWAKEQITRYKDIPLGTGHSAHELCSRIFISDQNEEIVIEDVLVQKVTPLEWIWNLDIDRENKTVSVGAPFLTSLNTATAVYREAQGCTLLNGIKFDDLASSSIKAINLPQESKEDYWPLGESGINPENNLNNHARINKAIDEMFREPYEGRFEQINTYAVLVIHEGGLVAERYSQNHHAENKMLGWSISKSVTALLLGILNNQGKVTLEDAVDLAYEPPHELKLRHVFNMASGLAFDEGYEGESDISNMLYLTPDASAFARSREMAHKPGTVFNYSTGDTQILSSVIQNAVGDEAQDAYDFYQQELFHKLGINKAIVEHDASGTFIGGARMFMRPRDWAKIGLLMAQEGEWRGEQIVSSDWVEEMLAPSPADSTYGGQVWLYEAETFGEEFPNDAYVLWGVLGQMIVVVPSEDLVVVRMGAKGSDLPQGIELDIFFNPVLEMIEALLDES
jgi:CubicO group peptidase (beta-lactamase class C family)